MGSPASFRWSALALGLTLGLLVAGVFLQVPRAQEAGREQKFSVAARKYNFTPTLIEVQQDDVVRITLTTNDIPHSFTIDQYRIAKRVEPGKTVVFEFRADQPGRFAISCNLMIDEGCREMHGELIVKPR